MTRAMGVGGAARWAGHWNLWGVLTWWAGLGWDLACEMKGWEVGQASRGGGAGKSREETR